MNREAIIVADLGFGDSGKGTMVDYLAREAKYPLVVRYNGGPQAAHNVIAPDGRHHTFAQLGSASFLRNFRTHLSQYMLINPFNLYVEAQCLAGKRVDLIWERLSIDRRAIVITPWHQAANRIREMSRGDGRHGSCGQGVGEARWDDLRLPDETFRAGDMHVRRVMKRKLKKIRDRKWDELKPLAEALPGSEQLDNERMAFADDRLLDDCVEFYSHIAWLVRITGPEWLEREFQLHDRVVFEGAQGVLLDEKFGFHPYTTWTNTTFDNAHGVLDEIGFDGTVTRLGVIRGYATRHGAGPFVTEDHELAKHLPEYHNGHNQWQQQFRVGYLDLPALKYAVEAAGGVDTLAVTGLDRMQSLDGWKVATAYRLTDGSAMDDLEVIRGEHNRAHMEALTNSLLTAKPVYQGVETPSGNGALATKEDIQHFLGFLSQRLKASIQYVSYGPTAADKQDLTT